MMSSFPSSASKTKTRPISTSHRPSQHHASHTASSSFKLSEDQLAEIREAFQLFDADRDEQLDYHELKVCLRALGFDLKKAEVLHYMKDANAGGGATGAEMRIGWERYSLLLEGLIRDRDPMVELRRAFRLFDDKATGKISLDNLRKVARDLGEELGDDELRAMIEEFDLDQDGMISEQEFLAIMADDL